MDVYTDGVTPLIIHICHEIGLVEVINEACDYDEEQVNLPPGERTAAMLANILEDRKPLYHLEEFYRDKDTHKLFGPDVNANHLNDDALGRGLDYLHEVGIEKVFSSVCLEARNREQISTEVYHGDTTSVSVQGEFQSAGEETLQITHGFSKDKRPDLNQFMYGLMVDEDGVPRLADVLAGNQHDTPWNNELIERIAGELMDFDDPMPVYVADCKAVSKENLKMLKAQEKEGEKIPFISRIPGTFSLEEQLRERAIQQDRLEESGTVSDTDGAAEYKTTAFQETLYGNDWRFVVVHSSKLAERKEKKIDEEIEERKKELGEEIKEFHEREFACREDALKALETFQEQINEPLLDIDGEIQTEKKRQKREGRGRPPNDWEPEYKDVFRAEMELSVNKQRLEKEQKMAGCFVLITNIMEEQKYSNKEVLEEYKNQTKVETSFRFLKDPKQIGPVYLKKPQRVKVLAYLFLMALLVYSLIQRRARKALQDEERPMWLVGDKESFRPTGNRVLERFAQMKTIDREGTKKREFPDNLDVPRRVFRLLGIAPEVYLQGPRCRRENKKIDRQVQR